MVSSEIESSPVGGEGENGLAAVPSLSDTSDPFQGRPEGGFRMFPDVSWRLGTPDLEHPLPSQRVCGSQPKN